MRVSVMFVTAVCIWWLGSSDEAKNEGVGGGVASPHPHPTPSHSALVFASCNYKSRLFAASIFVGSALYCSTHYVIRNVRVSEWV